MSIVRLGNATSKIGSGATPRGGKEVYLSRGEISLIRSQNITNFSFLRAGLAYISQVHAEQLSNVEVKSNDVLLNITGDSVARCWQPPADVLPARVNQHVMIIRPIPTVLDSTYLRYVMVSPEMQERLLTLASAGATRNALTKSMIENLRVPCPPISDQRRIAESLGALDDKIELNRKMNETLEEIARTIFTSWFVNFDPVRAKAAGRQPEGMDAATAALFPDSFVDSELGDIPTGWSVARVGEILRLEYGKALKESVRKTGTVPVFGSNGRIGYHNEPLAKGPGIVVGRKGTAGTVTRVYEDFFPIDTTFYVVLDSTKFRSMSFTFYMLRNLDLANHGSDSAVPGLNRNTALSFNVVVPPTEVLLAFDKVVNPMFDLADANAKQTKILVEIRDTVLPRLLSGEIRVSTANRELAEMTV